MNIFINLLYLLINYVDLLLKLFMICYSCFKFGILISKLFCFLNQIVYVLFYSV